MSEPSEVLIGRLLSTNGLKLAAAESCTGGLLADRITNIPGSSEYFPGGVVAYAYEAKVKLLGVSWDTLKAHGAVSRETVLEMARGARDLFEANLAISISGIAGPGGGLPGKPVGTTCFALVAPDGEWTYIHHFDGDRLQNKAASADRALTIILEYLEGIQQ